MTSGMALKSEYINAVFCALRNKNSPILVLKAATTKDIVFTETGEVIDEDIIEFNQVVVISEF